MVRAKQNDNSMEEDGKSSGGVYENHATPTLITVTTMLSAREEEKWKRPSNRPYVSRPTDDAPGTVFVDRRDPNLEKNPPSCDAVLPARERNDHAGETGRCRSIGFGSSSCSPALDASRFKGGWSW